MRSRSRPLDLARARLASQRLADAALESPRDVVRHLLAVQAQDHPGALWAVAVRTADARRAEVERAIARAEIVRTWPMRGTLHFVPAEDLRWLVALLAPRVATGAATRRRSLGLDAATVKRAEKVIVKALQGGKQLSRPALFELLDAHGIATANQRGIHIVAHLCHELVLCFGPHQGKQPALALLDEWVAPAKPRSREEALRELARRYVVGHGPASARDLAFWSGLNLGDARRALALAADDLRELELDGQTYFAAPDVAEPKHAPARLLPAFDELLIGYTDRSATLEPKHKARIIQGGMFLPTLVVDARIAGTWRRREVRGDVQVELQPFAKLPALARKQLDAEVERFRRFALSSPAS